MKYETDADVGLGATPRFETDADVGLVQDKKVSTASDVKQTVLPALGRGAAGLLSLPAFIDDAGGYLWRKGYNNVVAPVMGEKPVTYDEHMAERRDVEKQNRDAGGIPFPREYSYDYFKSKIEPLTGDYQPKTTAGKLVGTGVELLPNLIGNKGRLAGMLTKDIAIPAAVGTAAEAALEGTAYEPYAKIAGIVSGQMGAHGAHGLLKGSASGLAPIMGFEKPVVDATGKTLLNEAGMPVMATPKQQKLAATRFQEAAGLDTPATPQSPIIKTLDENLKGNIEGFTPTTYQATGNKGIGGLERGVQTTENTRFKQILEDQNQARVNALRSLQKDGSPETLVDYLRKDLDLLETKGNAAIESAYANAQTAGEKIASGKDAGSVGGDLRATLAAANKAEKEYVGNLYKAIGNPKEVTFATTPIKDTATKIRDDLANSAKQPGGEEAAIHSVIDQLGAVDNMKELTALRSRISSAMRDEYKASGSSEAYARLTQLRGGIQDAIDNGIKHRLLMEQDLISKGMLDPAKSAFERLKGLVKDGIPDNTVYAGNKPIDVKYDIVEHKDLLTSHGKDFQVNKNYPQELQPRDRSSAASQVQVENFAKNFDPERYGVTKDANAGAPIVNADNIVESGNGRTLALGKAYEQGKGEQYKEFLKKQGYNIDGFEQPVLVARRVTDMPQKEVQEYAQSLASQSGLRMTPAEMAARDAGRLSDDMFNSLAGRGSVTSDKDFARNFFKGVPVEEQATYVDRAGNLTQSGLARMEAAVLQKAYEDPSLTRRAVEALDPAGKNMLSGLADAAPEWAAMRSAVKSGTIPKDMDITQDIQKLVGASFSAKDKGLRYNSFLNQSDLEHGFVNKNVADLFFDAKGNILSKNAIAENLQNYAMEAQKTNVNDIFGAPSAKEVLAATKKNRTDLASLDGTVENKAPIVDAKAAKAPVLPNVDETVAPKLAQATSAYKDYAQTYKTGDVSKILRDGAVSDAGVLGKVFVAGPRGGEAAANYLKAAKNSDQAVTALQDAAMYSLERSGVLKDGVADPKALERWIRTHKEAVKQLPPEFAEKLSDAKTTSTLYNDLTNQYAKRIDAYNKSSLGKIIGAADNEEVVKRIGGLFNKQTTNKEITDLVDKVKDNPAALSGLQRSVSDYITSKFISGVEAGASGEKDLRGAAFRKFLADNNTALTKIYSPKEMELLRGIEKSLMFKDRSTTGSAIPGRTTSAQDLSPVLAKMADQYYGRDSTTLLSNLAAGYVGGQELGMGLALVPYISAKLTAPLYAKGVQNVEDLVWLGTKNPEFGRTLLMAKPYTKSSPVEQTVLNKLAKISVYKQIENDFNREEERKKRQNGGRVDLNKAIETAQRAVTRDSLPILNTPDEHVHQALRLARGG